jgi:2-hydroxy-3-keto-5-methylthiopentenyl-1-phosphate phosphatase
MKVIFLDFDGVLNHEKFYRGRFDKRYDLDYVEVPHPYSEIDPECVSILNYIIEKTGALVVLSTSWRHSGTDYCIDILLNRGFKGDVIDRTPDFWESWSVRGNEIQHWIDTNRSKEGIESYVILDDDSDMLLSQKNNFVRVDFRYGLTMELAETVISILNKL